MRPFCPDNLCGQCGRTLCPSGVAAKKRGQPARPQGPDSLQGQDVRTKWTHTASSDSLCVRGDRTEWTRTSDSLNRSAPKFPAGKRRKKNNGKEHERPMRPSIVAGQDGRTFSFPIEREKERLFLSRTIKDKRCSSEWLPNRRKKILSNTSRRLWK